MRNTANVVMTTTVMLCACAPSLANWNGSQVVTAIYPQDLSKDVLIQQPTYNDTGCTGPYGKYFRLRDGHPNYQSMYALLLSAFYTGQPVNIYVVNGACMNGYSEIALVLLGTLN